MEEVHSGVSSALTAPLRQLVLCDLLINNLIKLVGTCSRSPAVINMRKRSRRKLREKEESRKEIEINHCDDFQLALPVMLLAGSSEEFFFE